MNKPLLTRSECSILLGMAKYWDEVQEREDTSPLQSELADLYRRLGTRLLWITEEYAKCSDMWYQEQEVSTLITTDKTHE